MVFDCTINLLAAVRTPNQIVERFRNSLGLWLLLEEPLVQLSIPRYASLHTRPQRHLLPPSWITHKVAELTPETRMPAGFLS